MAASSPRTQTILSIVRIAIWAIIAIALVKFAFFPSASADRGTDQLDPTATYGQMTTQAVKGSITNSLSLEGTVEADPAAQVKNTQEGEVYEVYVKDGDHVEAGTEILYIQKQEMGDDTTTTDPATGQEIVTPGKPYWVGETVTSPAAGTIRLSALPKQQFAVGDVIATVQPPTFSAVASLTPDQMYRVDKVPEAATISIKNGPAPFDCHGLKIETPQGGQDGAGNATTGKTGTATGGGSGSDGGGTHIQARCAIPGDQKVFPGLQVTMDMVAGEATDVLTLPATAVEGRFENGYVYKPNEADPANPEKIQVKLGITDGTTVEIKEGLSEGQEVLEFVPGQQETAMQCDPMTGEGC